MAEPGRDPAEARLWWVTLSRLVGVGLVVLGLWLAGTTAGAGERPWVGLLVMALGLAWFVLVPRLLLKQWRSGG
ncbi:MAG: hypothetical protein ACK4MX_07715 [Thermaurantiacus sp.]